MSETPARAAPRPAATIVLMRDRPAGLELFMVVRHHEIDFASGALVFPGGRMEAADAELAEVRRRGRLEEDDDSLAPFKIAAIREAFEECGLLLARPQGDVGLVPPERLAALDRTAPFAELVRAEGLVPATDLLVPFARWITPAFLPKRFDTHFFLALAPPEQALAHDGREAVDFDLDFPARGAGGAWTPVHRPLSDRAQPVEARPPRRRRLGAGRRARRAGGDGRARADRSRRRSWPPHPSRGRLRRRSFFRTWPVIEASA